MKILHAEDTSTLKLPVYTGGAAIVKGALLSPGTTEGQDSGALIASVATGVDAYGVLDEPIAATDTDSDLSDDADWGTFLVTRYIPGMIIRVEYDMTATGLVFSTGGAAAATTVVGTSLEDNFTGWLYIRSGTGIGQLRKVISATTTTYTIGTAWTTAVAATDTAIKILPIGWQVGLMTTAKDKMNSEEAAGTWKINVVRNWIRYGGNLMELEQGNHSSLNSLNDYNDLTFYSDVVLRDSHGSPDA